MSDRTPPTATSAPGLAIICGGGSLPFAVADAGLRQGRHVVLFALRGWADPQRVGAYSHHWWRMGQWKRLIRIAEGEGCRDIVFIGSVTRPSWRQIQPDFLALWYVPRFIRLTRGGDDHLQSGLARFVEEFGFRLRAPQEIAPELMMPLGPLGACVPTERDRADIARGLALLAANSPFDVGQAVVVGNNQVLAVEGPEGTDQAVARVAELRRIGRIRAPAGVGVLIKAPKTGQDRRIDLPTIGPKTVESAASANLAGIAVVAGTTIVADFTQLAAAADRANIFVVGVSADGSIP
jgi:DUF1009 family protein